jgi:outer membrane protein OmpA-like peptidoglycan-associated protein
LLCVVALAACTTQRASGPKPSAQLPARPSAPVASTADPLATLEASLRTELAATAAVIDGGDATLLLRYPVRLAFAPDQNALLPAFAALLDQLAHTLRNNDRVVAEVVVYTDAIGSEQFNVAQSQQRGEVISARLRERGVAARRLSVRSGGESAPMKAENTPEGRDLNRRLEISFSVLSS